MKLNIQKTKASRGVWSGWLDLLWLAAGILLLVLTNGCSSIGGGASKGIASSQASEVQRDIPRILKDLDEAGKLIAQLTAGNATTSKGAIAAKIESGVDGVKALADRVTTLESSINRLEADNKNLNAKLDKVNSGNSQSIFWGSIGILAIAGIVVLAGVYFEQIKLKTMGLLVASYGFAGLILWRVVLSIEHIPDWFWWGLCGLGVAVIPVWYFFFHKPAVKKDGLWMPVPTPPALPKV